jgi:serine protease SohB
MSALLEIAVFTGKTVILVGLVGLLFGFIAFIVSRARDFRPDFELEDLNEAYKDVELSLQRFISDAKDWKKRLKAEKKQKKSEVKKDKPMVFVLDFEGDIRASAVENLRREITAILSVAKPERDEVVLRMESSGGFVHSYGLAASQLDRLRVRGLKLTICVDKIAASGGYMMAVIGSRIVAAPFAIIGSIGVVAQVPNVHRLLKKMDVDYQEMTAGEYKRTVSLFGEITEKGRAKFVEQLEDTHQLFKEFITKHRSELDLSKVATGEYWHGYRALQLGLVDDLGTSDDYLFQRREEARLVKVKVHSKQKFADRLAEMFYKNIFKWHHHESGFLSAQAQHPFVRSELEKTFYNPNTNFETDT